ncbi:MAG: hypothetical protein WCO52_02530 [bacterium]
MSFEDPGALLAVPRQEDTIEAEVITSNTSETATSREDVEEELPQGFVRLDISYDGQLEEVIARAAQERHWNVRQVPAGQKIMLQHMEGKGSLEFVGEVPVATGATRGVGVDGRTATYTEYALSPHSVVMFWGAVATPSYILHEDTNREGNGVNRWLLAVE